MHMAWYTVLTVLCLDPLLSLSLLLLGLLLRIVEDGRVLVRARVPLPVERVLGVAVALSALVCLARGAVLERLVAVSNVVEPVELPLVRKEGCADRVHGRVAPALIVEAAGVVEELKVLGVRLAAPEAEVSNLKVGPD